MRTNITWIDSTFFTLAVMTTMLFLKTCAGLCQRVLVRVLGIIPNLSFWGARWRLPRSAVTVAVARGIPSIA